MGSCFCCMSEDDQVKAVMGKLEVDRVANVVHGQTKFWVGRIVLTSSPLIAPVSGKQCAYYEVVCEEHVKHERTDDDGQTHVHWSWVHRFREQKSSDFLLADPRGMPAYVPGGSYPTKFYSVEDAAHAESRNQGGMFSMFTGDMGRKDTIDEMLRRNGQTGSWGRDDPGRFRYREGTFTVNEMVAILGTAQPYTHQGVNITILSPPTTNILNDEYFEKNEWTSNDKSSWEALTSTPSVIGSDDPTYFKGINVEDLAMNYAPFSFCSPVMYGQPMMQQQGQPMMMQQQGQPMMMQQQGQPMMMQQQGQPMMMQQQGQPMMMQQAPQQSYHPSTVAPLQQQQQPQQYSSHPSTVVPLQSQAEQQSNIIPTVSPGAVA